MYAVMRSYKLESGDLAKFERRVQSEFVPLISRAAGFEDYYFVRTSPDTFTTISVFDEQVDAQASVRLAAEWLRSIGTEWTLGAPDVRIGAVTCEAHLPIVGESVRTAAEVTAVH